MRNISHLLLVLPLMLTACSTVDDEVSSTVDKVSSTVDDKVSSTVDKVTGAPPKVEPVTAGQKIYQAAGRYGFPGIPAAEYVRLRNADPGIVEAIKVLDHAAHRAVTQALESYRAGNEDVSVELIGASDALMAMFELVIGVEVDEWPTSPLELGFKAAVLAPLGVRVFDDMRDWHKGYREDLVRFVEHERDPSRAEMKAMMKRLDRIHRRIQKAG